MLFYGKNIGKFLFKTHIDAKYIFDYYGIVTIF